ncbi:MAG: oxidoreductase [Candidatus Hydrogenedentota bacterium]
MRVLVLGGTGLISTAIVKRLIEKGHDPVLFNRGISARRFRHEVETIAGDRSDFTAFAKAMRSVKADAVIDMITFDAKTAAHNVRVFRDRVKHFIFCSTVCVYGGPLTQVPADESEPHRPVSEYGLNKSKAEAVYLNAFQESCFPVTMMRPSHCYGPGQPLLDIWGYNPSLVTRIRKGKPILVPGDGQGLWQPGYVGDMAKGFVGALGREATLGKAYNIVGDEIMTWREFHERMAKAIGCEAKIVPLTTPQIIAGSPRSASGMLAEIFQFHAAYTSAAIKRDIPEYRNLLSWEEGVKRTVAWMDETKVHKPANLYPWVDSLAAAAKKFTSAIASTSRRKA